MTGGSPSGAGRDDTARPDTGADPDGGTGGREPLLTVPNGIAALRVLGLAPLLWAAYGGHRPAFLWIMLALLASDWLDGKLAIWLDQATERGARLDSAADALMYAAFGLAFWWLEPAAIAGSLAWLAAAVGTWLVSAVVGLVRFGRLPSYHTRAAKASWLIGGVAAVTLVLTDLAWPFPAALAVVTLTNLEAVAIGLMLDEWRTNVPSILSVLG